MANADDEEWNQILRETMAANRPPVSQGESAARGGLQGVTSGFADEAAAGIETVASKIPGVRGFAQMFQPEGAPRVDDPNVTYEQRRDFKRGQNVSAQEANPITYGAGQVGGGIAQTVAMPFARAGTLAAGATQGAVSGVGYSDADTAGGMLGDAGKGALTGVAGTVAGKAIGKVVKGAVARSDDRAFKALGEDARQTVKTRLADQQHRITPVLKEPDVRGAAGKPGKMLDIAARELDASDAIATRVLTTLDKASGGGMRVQDVTVPIYALRAEMVKNSENPTAIATVDRVIDQFRNGMGKDNNARVPSTKVREFLTKQVQRPGFDRGDPLNNPPPSQEAYQRMSGVLKDAIHGYAAKHGSADASAVLQKQWDRSTAFSVMQRAAKEQMAKQTGGENVVTKGMKLLMGNKGSGLGGAAGYYVGGPIGAAVGAGVGHLASKAAPKIDDALARPGGQAFGRGVAGGLPTTLSQPVVDAVTAGDRRKAIDLIGTEVYGD